jgi:hypothetical protein
MFQEPSGLKRVAGRQSASPATHHGAHLKEDLMNTSLKTRATALVAAIVVTFGTIDLIAHYAYPTAPAVLVASTAR